MDAIGNKVILPTLPTQSGQSAAPVLPRPRSAELPKAPSEAPRTDFDAQATERKRFEAVQRAASGIANTFVVSDRRFTIFKDSTGQYVTRFTSLRDGKVTYIPEPELLRQSQSSAKATVNITA